MNKAQRAVVILGLLVIAGILLFPPFQGVRYEFGHSLWGDGPAASAGWRSPGVDYARLAATLGVVVVLAAAAFIGTSNPPQR